MHTTGTTAFYRPAGSGSFDVTASSTDAQSGILDYSFPALAGFTGSGAGATRTYTLATPTEPNGAKPVTARNQALLSSTATNFTLTSDSAVPTGGALTVNGVAASRRRHAELRRRRRLHDRPPHRLHRRDSPGSQRRRLTREQGTLDADACSAYGAPTTLVGTPAQSGLATGCYRYVLTGTDNVGNTVDRSPPWSRSTRPRRPLLAWCSPTPAPTCTPPAPPPSTAPPAAAPSTSPPRSTDAESGVLDYAFPALAGFTGSGAGATRTYTLATPTEPNGAKPVTARNQALLSSTRHQLHPHLRLGRADRRRADRQRHGRHRRRLQQLRRRRQRHDRPAHRLQRRRRLRRHHLDPHPRGRHAQRRRLLGLRRPHHPRRHPRPERPRHRLLPLHAHRHRQRRQRDPITTVVKVDLTDPTAPSLSLADTSADVHTTGTTAFYRPAGSGSFDVTASSTDGQSGIASLLLPGPRRLHPLRLGRRAHLHPCDPDRARRRQDRDREQQCRSHQQLHLHPHRGLGGSGRRRLDGERRHRERRRFAELRQRRHLHDRPPHRLHRRDLRPRHLDADPRGRHAQRRRLLRLRRPEHARRHPRPERTRHRLLPLHR